MVPRPVLPDKAESEKFTERNRSRKIWKGQEYLIVKKKKPVKMIELFRSGTDGKERVSFSSRLWKFLQNMSYHIL
jgi:hypothetical protein